MKRNIAVLLAVLFVLLAGFTAANAEKEIKDINDLFDLSVLNVDPWTGEYISQEEALAEWNEKNIGRKSAKTVITVYSEEEFEKVLRQEFKKHNPQIDINLYLENIPDDFDLTPYVQNARGKHTGVPDEGDYIFWNTGSFYITTDWFASNWEVDQYQFTMEFLVNYRHDADQEAAATKEIQAISASLGLNGKTELEKVREIYDYVAKNVRYDRQHDNSYTLKWSSYAAIVNKKAVCLGYATMTYRLLLMNGIDARIVISDPDMGNHAWLIVRVGDHYYYMDTTWASNQDEYGYSYARVHTYFLRSYDNIQINDTPKREHELEESSIELVKSYSISEKDYGPVVVLNSKGEEYSGKTIWVTEANNALRAITREPFQSQDFSWKTSDRSVAAVSSNGVVRFADKGSVTITVTNGDGDSDSVKLSYTPDPVELFVRRNYTMILGREAEPGGVAYWTAKLKNGEITAAKLMEGFVYSKEFLGKKYDNETTAEILYNTMLDRKSDANGKAYWAGQLNDGVSYRFIIRGFAGSAEFKNLCSKYGITPGTLQMTESRDKNLKLTQFITRNYELALQRYGDASGLNYWTGLVLSKKMLPKDTAFSFIFSAECKNRGLDDDDFVRMLYHIYMGRKADQSGFTYWYERLINGMDRATVARSFGNSKEFKGIVASYGL